MSTTSKVSADVTAEAAVSDVASDSLFAEVLSRIDDETDQILIFASIGLQISNRNLALSLDVSSADLTTRIGKILSLLREDREMADKLHDFRRAGRVMNYLALAQRLGLQDWFCAQCERFMVQPERGRRRKTCSDRCRLRRFRGQRPDATAPAAHSTPTAISATVPDETLSKLVAPIDQAIRPVRFDRRAQRWWQPTTQLRDRAIVLLGLSCTVALTSADIATLNVDDVVETAQGIELRLYRRAARLTRYVTILPRDLATICPTSAVLAWIRVLAVAGYRSGALFPKLDARERPVAVRLTGPAVSAVIEAAAAKAFNREALTGFRASTPVLTLVHESEFT